MRRLDFRFVAGNECVFEGASQFTNIPWPWVGLDESQGLFYDALNGFPT